MLAKSEIRDLLNRDPRFEDMTCSLRACARQPAAISKEAETVVAIARKFNEQVTRGHTLKLDARMQEDPEYLPWDIVEEANKWGFYTLFIPKLFGGKGYSLSCVGLFMEEIASECLAIANIIGVHYLGFTILTASWNIRMLDRISREVAAGEKQGSPCLISLAITEPEAGTDAQNIELMDLGNLGCRAEKANGGYRVNGTKIFISMGHISTWHIVNAYTDLNKGSESTVILAVKKGMPGFSLGRQEHKMGQKGCPASELVFRDCMVPADQVCFDRDDGKKHARGKKGTNAQIMAYIWGASRMGVAAFGTGAARGAFEAALQFARQTEADGRRLIEHEWCQAMLAEMYKNAAASRAVYMEATYANGMHGLWKHLNSKPVYHLNRMLPSTVANAAASWICRRKTTTRIARKLAFDRQTDAEINRVDGWASLAKFAATDAGVKNCQMALELMGQAGLRHDRRAEKMMRDAKLLQIYEGTNQINRINLFKRLIAAGDPDVPVFSHQAS